jgi:hypothetical protein
LDFVFLDDYSSFEFQDTVYKKKEPRVEVDITSNEIFNSNISSMTKEFVKAYRQQLNPEKKSEDKTPIIIPPGRLACRYLSFSFILQMGIRIQ